MSPYTCASRLHPVRLALCWWRRLQIPAPRPRTRNARPSLSYRFAAGLRTTFGGHIPAQDDVPQDQTSRLLGQSAATSRFRNTAPSMAHLKAMSVVD